MWPKRKGWEAQIEMNGKTTWLGSFTTLEDAARVYDKAALKCFGEFAKTNEMMGLLPSQNNSK